MPRPGARRNAQAIAIARAQAAHPPHRRGFHPRRHPAHRRPHDPPGRLKTVRVGSLVMFQTDSLEDVIKGRA
jgi:hypothetical protein